MYDTCGQWFARQYRISIKHLTPETVNVGVLGPYRPCHRQNGYRGLFISLNASSPSVSLPYVYSSSFQPVSAFWFSSQSPLALLSGPASC